MAKFDAQNATRGINMVNSAEYDFDTQDSSQNSSTAYSWLTNTNTDVQAFGTGMAWSGGLPTHGYVHSLNFDLDNNNESQPDFVVSNVQRYVTDVVSAPVGAFFLDILDGDDEVIGSDHDDTLFGYNGNDIMTGGLGANTIFGGDGNDVFTEGGTDKFFGGNNNDRVQITSAVAGDGDAWYGGDGIDTADFSALSADDMWINLDQNKWRAENSSTAPTETLSSFENVEGGSGDDKIYGDDGANVLNGNAGDDRINGHGGNDTINGGTGDNTLYGGSGNDTLVVDINDGSKIHGFFDGGSDHDRVLVTGEGSQNTFNFNVDGTNFRYVEELEFAADGANVDKTVVMGARQLSGLADELLIDGNDTIGSTDKIELHMDARWHVDLSEWTFTGWGDQNDLITIIGDSDDERIDGSSENDVIQSGGGDDKINSHAGSDAIFAGSGDDEIMFTESNAGDQDIIDGGSGVDSVEFEDFDAAVWVDLEYNGYDAWTRDSDDLSSGAWRSFADLSDVENIQGSTRVDYLAGDDGDNEFEYVGDAAYKGVEQITGRGGVDKVDFDDFDSAVWVDLDYAGATGHEAWTRDGIDVNSGAWRAIADLDGIENIEGTNHADYMAGNAADNIFDIYVNDSQPGVDKIDGRDGVDTADFESFSYGVWADLEYNGVEAWTQDSELLTGGAWRTLADLDNVENLVGTESDDAFYGDQQDNTFFMVGYDGDNGTGIDIADGRGGSDTADFSKFHDAVWVDLDYTGSTGYEAWTRDSADVDSGAWRAIANLTNIENVTGTNYSDKLTGDAGNNTFGYVGDGVDTGGLDEFNGESGSDTADFSGADSAVWVDLDYTGSTGFEAWTRGGTDVNSGTWTAIANMTGIENLTGSAYDDHLRSNTGGNVLTGGAGADNFVFEDSFGNDTVTDFQNGSDLLDFTQHSSVDSFADLNVSVVGDDTVVSAFDGAITLAGVTSGIDADDFVF